MFAQRGPAPVEIVQLSPNRVEIGRNGDRAELGRIRPKCDHFLCKLDEAPVRSTLARERPTLARRPDFTDFCQIWATKGGHLGHLGRRTENYLRAIDEHVEGSEHLLVVRVRVARPHGYFMEIIS